MSGESTALDRIQSCPLLRLDLQAVGDQLARAVITARQLGHDTTARTIQDYWAPGGSPEHEFIRDVFTLSPDEIAERWMDGESNAVQITRAILDQKPMVA
jgi:hypothetical protein